MPAAAHQVDPVKKKVRAQATWPGFFLAVPRGRTRVRVLCKVGAFAVEAAVMLFPLPKKACGSDV